MYLKITLGKIKIRTFINTAGYPKIFSFNGHPSTSKTCIDELSNIYINLKKQPVKVSLTKKLTRNIGYGTNKFTKIRLGLPITYLSRYSF